MRPLTAILVALIAFFGVLSSLTGFADPCTERNQLPVLTQSDVECIGFDFVEGQVFGSTAALLGQRATVDFWAKGTEAFPPLNQLRATWKSVSLKDFDLRQIDQDEHTWSEKHRKPDLQHSLDFGIKYGFALNRLSEKVRNAVVQGTISALYNQITADYDRAGCSYKIMGPSCDQLTYSLLGLYLALKQGDGLVVFTDTRFHSDDLAKAILRKITFEPNDQRATIIDILLFSETNEIADLNSIQYLIGVLSGVFLPNGIFVGRQWDSNSPFHYVNSWRVNIDILRRAKSEGAFTGDWYTAQAAKRLELLSTFVSEFFSKADSNTQSHFTPQQYYIDLGLLQEYYVSTGEIASAEEAGIFRANFRAGNPILTPSPRDRLIQTKFWGALTGYGTLIAPVLYAWAAATFVFALVIYFCLIELGWFHLALPIRRNVQFTIKLPYPKPPSPDFRSQLDCVVDSIYGASQLMTLRDYERLKNRPVKTVLSIFSAIFVSFAISYCINYVSRNN